MVLALCFLQNRLIAWFGVIGINKKKRYKRFLNLTVFMTFLITKNRFLDYLSFCSALPVLG